MVENDDLKSIIKDKEEDEAQDTEKSPYKDLPDELIEYTNSFLKITDLFNASLASKKHLDLGVDNENLWKELLKRDFGDPDYILNYFSEAIEDTKNFPKEVIKDTHIPEKMTYKMCYKALTTIRWDYDPYIKQYVYLMNYYDDPKAIQGFVGPKSLKDVAVKLGLDVLLERELQKDEKLSQTNLKIFLAHVVNTRNRERFDFILKYSRHLDTQKIINTTLSKALLHEVQGYVHLGKFKEVPPQEISDRKEQTQQTLEFIFKLDSTVNVNQKSTVRNNPDICVTNNGETLLILAIQNNLLPKTIQLLIKHGVEVNAEDNNQKTPLHHAAILKNKEVIEILLKNGARPTWPDKDEKLPVNYISGDDPLAQELRKIFQTYSPNTASDKIQKEAIADSNDESLLLDNIFK